MTDVPDNAIVLTDIEVVALKKLVLISHALGHALSDAMASREQQALTGVLSDVVRRADHSNLMNKMAKPQDSQP